MIRKGLFTSEAVARGHPDKICDQISDAVLDAVLARAKDHSQVRAGVEVLVKDHHVVLAGELRVEKDCELTRKDCVSLVHEVITESGYLPAWNLGFDAETCEVQNLLGKQSPDIERGVDPQKEKGLGAGDQGMVFGYACDEVPEVLMPAPVHYAHQLMHRHEEVMCAEGENSMLRPDAKSQVTFRYRDGIPEAIDTIVLSTQHRPELSGKELEEFVREHIIGHVIPDSLLALKPKILINPAGSFVLGGPMADCGLTGRKLIVDTYGGMARHGGGAFSGKDPSKVDRSASYAARYVAKNIVHAGLARKCEVQIAYAIGVPQPVSVFVDTSGECCREDEETIEEVLRDGEIFDLTPSGIIRTLGLLGEARPCYRDIAAHGHFGHTDTKRYPWEDTDRAEQIRQAVGGK